MKDHLLHNTICDKESLSPPFLGGEKITYKGKSMKEQDYLSSSYDNNNIESYLPEALKKNSEYH